MSMLLTCAETAALLSDYEEGILPLGLFLKVKVHLFNCPSCRALLATLRALPELLGRALGPEDDFEAKGQAALQAVLGRLGQPRSARPWPATPIPEEARELLASQADLPLRILAAAHRALAQEQAGAELPYHLPGSILAQLPVPEHWGWETDPDGLRKAELLADPEGGQRLVLVEAPPGARLTRHHHLGSESILILQGAMEDRGLAWNAGAWLHHPRGSSHGPSIPESGCWYLVREEGSVRFRGPAGWLRNLRTA